jgi:hypothetical protein
MLLTDDRLHREMSDRCLDAIQQYSWDRILGRIEAALSRAAGPGI